MNFSLGLPKGFDNNPGVAVDGESLSVVAQAAEQAGFYSIHVADHPFPSNEWLETGGRHSPDPFVTLAFAAAKTKRIRLMTNVLVLPYRHPAIIAKSIATLDQLSNGRMIVGIGAGYEAHEFEALGVEFLRRNELTDVSLEIMDSLWEGKSIGNHSVEPRPRQYPRPPVWIGGNSRVAMRRAVDLGDGWMPMANPATLAARRRTSVLESIDDLRASIDRMRQYASEVNRTSPVTLSFTPFSPLPSHFDGRNASDIRKEIEVLAELGVSHLRVEILRGSESSFLEAIDEFSTRFISRI